MPTAQTIISSAEEDHARRRPGACRDLEAGEEQRSAVPSPMQAGEDARDHDRARALAGRDRGQAGPDLGVAALRAGHRRLDLPAADLDRHSATRAWRAAGPRTRAGAPRGRAALRPGARACGYAAPTPPPGGAGSSSRSRPRRASGSAASVSARTTATRVAPAPTTPADERGVDPADGEERHRGVRGRVAHQLEADRRPARLGRRGVHRARRRCSRRPAVRRRRSAPGECVESPTSRSAPTIARASRHGRVVLADVDAVGAAGRARSGRSLTISSAPAASHSRRVAPRRRRRSSSSSAVLDPQLDDVDAAAQRGARGTRRSCASQTRYRRARVAGARGGRSRAQSARSAVRLSTRARHYHEAREPHRRAERADAGSADRHDLTG